jgi:hypothetical protein
MVASAILEDTIGWIIVGIAFGLASPTPRNDRRQSRPQRLSCASVEGAGDGVAAKGLTVGAGAGAAPVVVGQFEDGGALAVVEIGTVCPYTSIM